MEDVYKWCRILAIVFVGFLMLVTALPYVIIALNGVDETTVPTLITATFFLIPLFFMALSVRFMHKNETTKKKRIGLAMFLTMMLLLLVFSLFRERQYQIQLAEARKQQALQQAEQQKNNMAEAIKFFMDEAKKNNSLEVEEQKQ